MTIALAFLFDKAMLYTVDVNGKYLTCNAVYANFVGLEKPNEIIGKTIAELPIFLLSPMLADNIHRNNLLALSGTCQIPFEERCGTKDKKDLILISQKYLIFDKEEKVTGVTNISYELAVVKYLTAEKESFLDGIIKKIRRFTF